MMERLREWGGFLINRTETLGCFLWLGSRGVIQETDRENMKDVPENKGRRGDFLTKEIGIELLGRRCPQPRPAILLFFPSPLRGRKNRDSVWRLCGGIGKR